MHFQNYLNLELQTWLNYKKLETSFPFKIALLTQHKENAFRVGSV
jgi:hypothetical protein